MRSVTDLVQRVARIYGGVWYRMVLPLGAVFLAYVVSLVLLAVVLRPLLVPLAEDVQSGSADPTLLGVIALIPVLVLLGLAGVVWGGATAYVADGTDAGRATSPWRSTWLAVRRVPAGFGAVVVWAAAVVLAVLLFPLLIVAGVVGLVLTPFARRGRFADRWPSWPELVLTALPFGFALLIATRWSLAFPAVFLDGVGVRQACANSWRAVRGRTAAVGVVLALTVLVVFVLTFMVRAVVEPILSGDAQVIVAQLVAQAIVAPLLVVALAVLYRARGAEHLVRPALAPVKGSHRIAIGILVIVAIVAQMVPFFPHATAYAAPTTETVPGGAPTAESDVGALAVCPDADPGSQVTFGHTSNLDNPLLPGVPTEFAVSVGFDGPQDPPCDWIQPSGDVDLFIDDVELAPFTPPPPPLPPGETVAGSVAYLTSFTAGIHTIKVVYGGDATFAAAETSFPITVGTPSTTTAVTVAASPVVFGQPVTYEASVTGGGPTPTGIVKFYGANDPFLPLWSFDAPLVGGTATLTTTAIPMGSHNVVAEYQGDSTYLSSTWDPPHELVVFPANTRTTLSVSPSGRTDPGETVAASVQVLPFAPSEVTPQGTVRLAAQSRAGTVDIATGTLVDGRVTIRVAPPPGTLFLFAIYIPADGSWVTSSTSERHEVASLAPRLTLTAASNPAAFGQPLTFVATVTAGTPATGTVTFTARRLSAPATGSTTATVSHSANLDEPLPANTDVPFNVGLDGAAGGRGATPTGLVTVRIDDGAIPVVPPTRTLAPGDDPLEGLDFTAVFPPGEHTITVSYAGDETFAPQEQVIDVTAHEVAGAPRSTRSGSGGGSGSNGSGGSGGSAGPSGPDVVELGVATLDAAGRATITTADLPPGVYAVEARYSGNATIQPLQSPPLTQTVSRAPVTMSASTTDVAPKVGDQVAVKVDVTPPTAANLDTDLFRQKITLLDGTEEVGSGLLTQEGASFSTTITFRMTGVGTRTLTATYPGDDALDRARASVAVEVARQETGVRMFGFLHRAGYYGDDQVFDGAVTTTGPGTPTGTVQLQSTQGVLDTATLDADGNFSMHTRALQGGRQRVWVDYAGDEQFLPSSVLDLLPGRDDRVAVEVAKGRAVPEVSFTPKSPTVGEDVNITAVLEGRGAGPTGTVEFFDVDVNPRQLLGSARVVDGVATLKYAPTKARTLVLASYGGDRNFAPTENPLPYALLQAEPASATLAITGPGELSYGSTGALVVTATSATTGRPASGSITFESKQGSFRARDVRLVDGQARLEICSGDAPGCGTDAVTLAAGVNEVTARYSSSSGGAAAPVSGTMEVTAAPTVLVLTTPEVVPPGSGATLAADVTYAKGRPVTAGSVVFSGLEPRDGGGSARVDLGRADVDAKGHASLVVGKELAWPVAAIEARYARFDERTFGPSSATNPITIQRTPTRVKVFVPTAAAGQAAEVSAGVERGEGGSAIEPTGTITITADNGTTCTEQLDADRAVPCSVTWADAGEHSVSAAYSGDTAFEPSQSSPFAFTGSRGTPNLRARLSSPVVEGAESEVTWVLPAGATGRVTVVADGGTWCDVDVTALACSGTFGRDAALERISTVRVRYSGDSTWNGVEEQVKTQVQGCVPIEVVTYEPSAGSVVVNTPPNCGDGRYLVGTEVSVTASPFAPNEFRGWLRLDGRDPGWTPKREGAKDLSTSFVVGEDFSTWAMRASFALPCLRVEELIGGEGELQPNPEPDCKLPNGDDGYSYGTTVDFVAVGLTNPKFEEPDVFFRFNPVPTGAQVFAAGDRIPLDPTATLDPAAADSEDGDNTPTRTSAIPIMRVPLTTDVTIGAVFGPLCRNVSVAVGPASDGDESEILTPTNCQSPDVRGFTRFTKVKVKATSGDESLVRDGWDVNGTPAPELGEGTEAKEEAELLVDGPDLEVTARYVHCFTLRAEAAPGEDVERKPLGKVTADPAPNCPDGSKRYLEGTPVELEPVVVSEGATFVGWDTPAPGDEETTGTDDTGATASAPRSLDGSTHDPSAGAPDAGIGIPAAADTGATDGFLPADDADLSPTGARTVVVDRDIETFATFYLASVCSQLGINAPAGLVTFAGGDGANAPTGCGPGYYYDQGKAFCLRNEQSCKVGTQEEIRNKGSDLQLVLNPENKLQVSVSVSGNAPACFPLECPGPVTGNILVRFTACQSVKANILVQRVDDAGNPIDDRTYSPDDFGGMGQFPWIDGYPTSDCTGGQVTPGAAGAWQPGSFVELRTSPPAVGFRFLGWGEVDNEVGGFTDTETQTSQESPSAPVRYLEKEGVVIQTTDDRPQIQADAFYGVQCGTLSLGEGISIVSPPPNCPGGENSYVIGSFVMVNAAPQVGSRTFYSYKSGIVADTVTEQRDAIVLIGGPLTSVTGNYPTRGEEVANLFAQAGKYVVGLLAVAAPILLTAVCGPCGVAIAALTLSAVLIDFIPGVDGKATAALQGTIFAPLHIAECSAQWGFANGTSTGYKPPPLGSPTIGQTVAAAGNVAQKGAAAAFAAGKAAFTPVYGPALASGVGPAATPGTAALRSLRLQSTPQGFQATGALQSTAAHWRAFRFAKTYGVPAAAFGYGVYANGGFNTKFDDFKTVDELRDTENFENCMAKPFATLGG